jgi:hypothetical protein
MFLKQRKELLTGRPQKDNKKLIYKKATYNPTVTMAFL